MRAVPLLLVFLPIALGIAHPHGVRPRFVQNAAVTEVPQLVTHPENNDMLHEVRRNMQRVRGLRRRAKVQAMQLSRSSRAAADAVHMEAERYAEQLAELEDIQRAIMRAAKAGLLRERRLAERRFQKWRSGRDEL